MELQKNQKQNLEELPNSWSAELGNLIYTARCEGKLIQAIYHGLIFTPDGLYREIAKGRFRWGVVNWRLIEPSAGQKIDYP